MNGNSFVEFLLKSPLHGMMSGSTMLIMVAGRKTGKQITTPVNYARDGNTLWVISRRERKWWKNVMAGAPVRLLLRGRVKEGFARAIVDEVQVASHLPAYLTRIPMSARSLGVRVENGVPNPEDSRRAAKDWLMVRVDNPI